MIEQGYARQDAEFRPKVDAQVAEGRAAVDQFAAAFPAVPALGVTLLGSLPPDRAGQLETFYNLILAGDTEQFVAAAAEVIKANDRAAADVLTRAGQRFLTGTPLQRERIDATLLHVADFFATPRTEAAVYAAALADLLYKGWTTVEAVNTQPDADQQLPMYVRTGAFFAFQALPPDTDWAAHWEVVVEAARQG